MLQRKRQKIKEAADRADAESVDDAAVVDDMFDFLSDMSTAEQSQSGPTLFKDLPAPKNIQVRILLHITVVSLYNDCPEVRNVMDK